MELQALNIPEKKLKQLQKAGIASVEDLLTFYPRKYQDRSLLTGARTDLKECVFLFVQKQLRRVTNKVSMVVASGMEYDTGLPIEVKWFNQPYIYSHLCDLSGELIVVSGKVTENTYMGKTTYDVICPSVYASMNNQPLGIYPIYRKIPGMAEDYLRDCIAKAFEVFGEAREILPERILEKEKLPSYNSMIRQLHNPESILALEAAKRRQRWNDLMYFALRIELENRNSALGSPYSLATIRIAESVRKSLPFELTADQLDAYRRSLFQVRSGKRLNALVQGDVGCGKTIVALLLMIAFAENGYQAALMAPTQILAGQHYTQLKELVKPYGMEVAFVSGQRLPKAEQTALRENLANGKIRLIVGTQALLSESYSFHKLALVIEDEEHKYGVLQRKALTDKAAAGTHTVTMSATPIPRTLAQILYGESLQLFSIKTKPSGRQPVQTGIGVGMDRVLSYILNQVKRHGHQAYVVCPMITATEKMEGVDSVETVYELYSRCLSPYGVTVGVVTGKTKKQEAMDILAAFKRNEISVLVSTTVVEVGVDVPNATVIIIHNAERFGLAQLHQLRGRVGRGKDPGICVLLSEEKDNPRLQAMCDHADGFSIAEMDLQQRGAGDFLGSQQSGTEKYLALALCNPQEYKRAQSAAVSLLDIGENSILLEQAISDVQNNVSGEMLKG